MKSLDRHVDLLRHDAWEVSKKIYNILGWSEDNEKDSNKRTSEI